MSAQTNVLRDGAFEEPVSCETGTGGFRNGTFNPAYPEMKYWLAYEETPDYFHAGACIVPPTYTGQPLTANMANQVSLMATADHTTGQTGQGGYAGIRAYYDGRPRNEKIQQTAFAAPLVLGKTYYAEFFAAIAPDSRYTIPSLSMALRDNAGQLRVVAGGTPSNVVGSWDVFTGAFEATYPAQAVVIGNLPNTAILPANGPGANYGFSGNQLYDNAYYFLDDAHIYAFPEAGPNVSLCGASTSVALGTAPLPATSGATYVWEPSTGLSSTSAANPIATPPQTTSYTLTVTAQGKSYTSQVTVSVCPCDHAYSYNAPAATYNPLFNQPQVRSQASYQIGAPGVITTLNASDYGGQVIFDGQYQVLGPLRFVGGTFRLRPGTTFFFEPQTNALGFPNGNCILSYALNPGDDQQPFLHLEGAELVLTGATLTSSCEKMWRGVILGEASSLRTEAATGPKGRLTYSVIRDAFMGVYASEDCLGANMQLRLNRTTFLNNLYDVIVSGKQTVAPSEGITNCVFSSLPHEMLYPYHQTASQAQAYYTETGVWLRGGEYGGFDLSGNQFTGLRTGLLASGENLQVKGNTFADNFDTAIRLDLADAGTSLTIAENTITVPSRYFTSSRINADNPAVGIGLLGSGCNYVTITGNLIDGGSPATVASPKKQFGVDAIVQCNLTIADNNSIRHLDEGVRTQDFTNMMPTNTRITDNSFLNNQRSLSIPFNYLYYTSTTTPTLLCNTLENSGLPQNNNSGIYIYPNASNSSNYFVFGGSSAPCGNKFTNVDKGIHTDGGAVTYYRSTSSLEAPSTLSSPGGSTITIIPVGPINGACQAYPNGVQRTALPAYADVVIWLTRLRLRQGTQEELATLEKLIVYYHQQTKQYATLEAYVATLPLLNADAFEHLSLYLMQQYRQNRQEAASRRIGQTLRLYQGTNPRVRDLLDYFAVMGNLQTLAAGQRPAAADSAALVRLVGNGSEVARTVLHFYYPQLHLSGVTTQTRQPLKSTPAAATAVAILSPAQPNPASTTALFRYESFRPAVKMELAVYDVKTGRLVHTMQLPVALKGEAALPVQQIPDGLYVCKLLADGQPVATQKLAVSQ